MSKIVSLIWPSPVGINSVAAGSVSRIRPSPVEIFSRCPTPHRTPPAGINRYYSIHSSRTGPPCNTGHATAQPGPACHYLSLFSLLPLPYLSTCGRRMGWGDGRRASRGGAACESDPTSTLVEMYWLSPPVGLRLKVPKHENFRLRFFSFKRTHLVPWYIT